MSFTRRNVCHVEGIAAFNVCGARAGISAALRTRVSAIAIVFAMITGRSVERLCMHDMLKKYVRYVREACAISAISWLPLQALDAAAAGTLVWQAQGSGGFRATAQCGGRQYIEGLFATAQEGAAAVCEQQACDAYSVENFRYLDARTVAFVCYVNGAPGAQLTPAWGTSSISAIETSEPKMAGGCPGTANGGAPCQGQQGNPIRLATGNKYQVENDYAATGAYPLRFAHYYNSTDRAIAGRTMGQHRRHTYERFIAIPTPALGTLATATRHDGTAFTFTLTGGVWKPDADVTARLFKLEDGAGNAIGWQYIDGDDELETYDGSGRLLYIENRAGVRHTLSYDDQGRLVTVTDAFGHTLDFTYDVFGRVVSLNAAGGLYAYDYDRIGSLAKITYPDGTAKTLRYEVAGRALLTGITDENGDRYSTYTYDLYQGRAIRSELAGGVNRTDVQPLTAAVASVTDALGKVRIFTHYYTNGVWKNDGVDAPCSTCEASAFTYDGNGFIASNTDFNGNRTNYTRDARGLETKRVEGLTSAGAVTSVTRTITTEWHATYRLPTRIAEPLRLTTITYGGPTDSNPGNRGSVLSKTVQATTDANGSLGISATVTGLPRTWTYTYNTNGQVLTVDGPRTDVSDVTTYAYYPNDAECVGASATGCRGQLASITNALGHVTTIQEYNAHGQPLRTIDANGLVTTIAYDARMRVTNRTVGGESTSYAYDAAGQLAQVTLPDGSFLTYRYDAAHRVTGIQDNQGNKVAYTLDLMGNRIKEDVLDPSGALSRTKARVYDSLNRLLQDIGARNQTITYGYDNQGNVTSIDGPLAGTVDLKTNTYDALNRLARVIDPNAGQVNYGYDGRDQLVSVSDPRALTTTYAYDGVGNLGQLVSPDTGTATSAYDAAGNVTSVTDAKGQQTRYTYDALNRVTRIEYFAPGPVLKATHSFTYDEGVDQKGRLTLLVEPGSTTLYSYDQKGRLTSETRTINGIAYTTAYTYDAQGRQTSVTYPSGRRIAYALDGMGRVQGISTEKDGTSQVIVSNVAYQPFGSARSYTFGNGQTYTRGFDSDGRVASYTLATQTFAVQYDAASRITSLEQAGLPGNTNAYGYDVLDRLTSFVGPSTTQAFTYDAVGNRTSKTMGAASAGYAYSNSSNRLTAVTGAGARDYTYDALGSVMADGVNSFVYDMRARMAQSANSGAATEYTVNALGQRIRKSSFQADTVFHYDAQGRLIAESSAAGQVQKEYVYLGDIPVAVLQ
jgi:YD repeat-containing protein